MIYPKTISLSLICFLSSLSFLLDCTNGDAVQSETSGNTRVIGGQDASKNEFPFLVNFLTLSNVFCSGVILNKDWILTAGHCAKEVTLATLINAGDYNLYKVDEAEQIISPQKVVVHENYTRNDRSGEMVNDIGLIMLKTPLQFNTAIKAIELPPPTLSTESGTVTLAGWGKLNLTTENSPILQKVNLTIIPLSECQRNYTSISIKVTNDSVCTGITKSPCHGDEGSPLLCQYNGTPTFVCGIYSFGGQCDLNRNHPSVNAKVTAYLPWINRTMTVPTVPSNANSVGCSKVSTVFIIMYVSSQFFI